MAGSQVKKILIVAGVLSFIVLVLVVIATTSSRRQSGTAEIEKAVAETPESPASSSAHGSQRDTYETEKDVPDAESASSADNSPQDQDTARTEEDVPDAESASSADNSQQDQDAAKTEEDVPDAESASSADKGTFKDFSLIFTYIDKGLGDFYWTINIYREILDIRKGSPVCIVAFLTQNAHIDAVRREHTNFVFRDVASIDEVVLERDVFYVLQERCMWADRTAAFDKINALAKTAGTCICFDTCYHFFSSVDAIKCFEYDYASSAILLKDYSNIPFVDGYRKTDLSPADYRNTLPEYMQEKFDVNRVTQLLPDHEYIFCYFYATCSSLPYSLSHLVMMVSEMMRLDGRNEEKVTVLSNFSLNKLLEWNMFGNHGGELESLDEKEMMEMIKQNLMFVDVDFDRGTMWHKRKGDKKKGPVFEFVCYGQVTEPEFEYLLLRSGEIAGCTGDMSVSQVLSTGRLMAYQCLSHKERFVAKLADVWKAVNGDENYNFRMFYALTSTSNNRIGGFPNALDTKLLREQYKAFLARLKENDFRKKLEREVRERS